MSPLWCSLGRAILEGPKHDSLSCSLSLSLSLSLVVGDNEDLLFVDGNDGRDEEVGSDDDDPTGEMSVWVSILPTISSVWASISGIICIVSSFFLIWR